MHRILAALSEEAGRRGYYIHIFATLSDLYHHTKNDFAHSTFLYMFILASDTSLPRTPAIKLIFLHPCTVIKWRIISPIKFKYYRRMVFMFKKNVIGICVTSIHKPSVHRILAALSEEAGRRGYYIHILYNLPKCCL